MEWYHIIYRKSARYLSKRRVENRVSKAKSKAFTLPEVLVAAAIALTMALVLVMEFTQSRSAVDLATAKIEMQQLGRRVVDRITPYISSAVDRGDIFAVDLPNVPGIPSEYVIFNTTEDFLDPNYDPERVISPRFFEGRDYPTYQYIIWFEDDQTSEPTDIDQNSEAKVVMMARLNTNYDRNNPWPSIDTTVAPRVLIRGTGQPGKQDGAVLRDVKFQRLLSNAIEVRVVTEALYRESHGNTKVGRLETVSVIQLPSYTVR